MGTATVRVVYKGSHSVEDHIIVLGEDSRIKHEDLLVQLNLLYAVDLVHSKLVVEDAEGYAVCENISDLHVTGAKFERKYSKRDWLTIPSSGGKVFREAQYEYLTSTVVKTFPVCAFRVPGIKQVVMALAAALNDTGMLFGPNPADNRPIASSEEEIRQGATTHTFKPVADVLEQETRGVAWHPTMKKGLRGRTSIDQDKDEADWNLGRVGARDVRGSGEGKAAWILFKGWKALDKAARDVPREDRTLIIQPGEQPIDLVERYNEPAFNKNDPVIKTLGQSWGYAVDEDGEIVRAVVPISCDAALWLLFPHPENANFIGVSDPILLHDLEPTQRMALYYASQILLGDEPLPPLPSLADIPVPAGRSVARTALPPQSSLPSTSTSTSTTETGSRRRPSRLGSKEHQTVRTLMPTSSRFPTSPNREPLLLTHLLQGGHAGPVYEGRSGSTHVVVKTARTGKSMKGVALLARELRTLQALQGQPYFPKLIAYGFYEPAAYALTLEYIPGSDMVPTDAHHLPAAMRSLNSLHACGYKHGDIRLENLRVGKSGKVFVLDFGASSLCFEKADFEDEERQLRGLFQDHHGTGTTVATSSVSLSPQDRASDGSSVQKVASALKFTASVGDFR